MPLAELYSSHRIPTAPFGIGRDETLPGSPTHHKNDTYTFVLHVLLQTGWSQTVPLPHLLKHLQEVQQVHILRYLPTHRDFNIRYNLGLSTTNVL